MSLVVLACNCANSLPMARSFLSSHHHPNPFSVPVYRGEEAKGWAKKNNLSDISAYLSKQSSYVIFAGWDKSKRVFWADINLPSPKESIKADSLISRFA